MGAEYDELGAKINVLVTQIEKLRALNGEEVADGVFTAESKELKKLSDEIARLKDLQEKRKNAGKGTDKTKEPESLQEQLDAMDSFYSKQTQDAEQYGRNIKEIEEKWQKTGRNTGRRYRQKG